MAAPENTVAPSFTGALRTLATQTGASGTWIGADDLDYQWQRAEPVRNEGVLVTNEDEVVTGPWEDIVGATSSTYKLIASETGYMVRLRVIGTNGDGSATAYAEQDGPIATFVFHGLIRSSIGGALPPTSAEDEDQ